MAVNHAVTLEESADTPLPHNHHDEEEQEQEEQEMIELPVFDDDSVVIAVEAVDPETPEPAAAAAASHPPKYSPYLIYSISVYAFLGAVTRAYLNRSLSCDYYLCLTSADSALFVDLPANLVGSFFMGTLLHTHFKTNVGLQVGFCGSLTTFAAWNMQMVILLEQGKIASALFGYIIGTLGAYGSFQLGLALATLLVHARRDNEHSNDNARQFPMTQLCLFPPTLLTCGLLVLFLTLQNDFHSSLASLIWTAPAGALTRWYLAIHYNTVKTPTRGTLIANWSASIVFAIVAGLNVTSFPLTAGFIGSLSTVSSWVKEIHATPWNWIYAAVTLVGAMMMALVVYLPLHRFV